MVADEVRTLAQRSAAAARETAQKIETAVKHSSHGTNLGQRAEKRFAEITAITAEYQQLVKGVEVATRESSDGFSQVSVALEKVDQITQRTAGAAEENANASEEMRAQVEQVFAHIKELEMMILSESQR